LRHIVGFGKTSIWGFRFGLVKRHPIFGVDVRAFQLDDIG
jgi:hypothetical protein